MINTIKKRVLTILQNDARLILGGNAYAPNGSGMKAWGGVTRPDEPNGGTPTAGWVNIFNSSQEASDEDHSPAIYCGTKGMSGVDRPHPEDRTDIAQGGYREKRLFTLPLIIVVLAPSKTNAEDQRDQLRMNIFNILCDHFIEDGYWYRLQTSDAGAGLGLDRFWVSAEGSGSQLVATAVGCVPVDISYTRMKGSLA